MKRREVVYALAAEEDLDSIFAYVSDTATPTTALAFVQRVDAFCRSLEYAAERGGRHDDIREGLRSVGYEGRVTIVFHVAVNTVSILRIFYAGRDWQSELGEPGA